MSAPTDVTTTPARAADGDVTAEVALAPEPHTIGPSGWRRIILGLLVGLAAGALLALVLPRREPQPVEPGGVAITDPGARDPAVGGRATRSGHETVPDVTGADDDDDAAAR